MSGTDAAGYDVVVTGFGSITSAPPAILTITPANDTNFTLSIAATEKDAEGNISATTNATESVTVNPLAPTVSPVAETGVEGQAIALNLGTTVNHLAGTNGDGANTNSLNTLSLELVQWVGGA